MENFRKYWDNRINKYEGSIRSVGNEGFSERVNKIIYKAKFDILEKLFKKKELKNNKILDAGCGVGIFSKWYKSKGANVFAVDQSFLGLIKARNECLKSSFAVADLTKIPFKDSFFDIIHCFDVLYHIVDDYQWKDAISEFSRIIKPNGLLVLLEGWSEKEFFNNYHVKFRSKKDYLSYLEYHAWTLEEERELYLILHNWRIATKIAPQLCLQAEKLFTIPSLRGFAKAKVVTFKKTS